MPQQELQEQEEQSVQARLVLKRYHDGGHIKVVDELPEPEYGEVSEATKEVGNKQEFPIERDRNNTVITLYHRTSGQRNTVSSYFKTFDISLKPNHPEVDRVRELLETVRQLPELEEKLNELSSYQELKENAETVRKYQAIYRTVQQMWFDNTISSYAEERRARLFEIDQAPQGFYKAPMLFNSNANEVIGEHLKEEEIGFYNIVW